jgi:serine/threonine-protein kinase
MGSPLYMSPEQMSSSKDVDAQTDIWALGVILFELMTGHPAFVTDSVIELAKKISTEATPSIRSLRPEVPIGLEAIVFRCLEKDPHQRFPNVAELAMALLPFGPERAKASVERISGVMQAAGLALAPPLPPSPLGAGMPGSATVRPITRTTVGRSRAKVAATVMGLLGVLSVTAAATVPVRSWRKLPASDAAAPPMEEVEEDLPDVAMQLALLPSPPLVTDAQAATTSTVASSVASAAVTLSPVVSFPVATTAPSAVRRRDPSTQVAATVHPDRSNADPLSRLRPK